MLERLEGFKDTKVVPVDVTDDEDRDVLWLDQDNDVIEIDKRQARKLIEILQHFCRR